MNLVESAKRAAEEVAAAVNESAEQAQQTAEVATRAREIAQQGVAAAEQANEAMGSVRDSSESVSAAIRELAAKSEQIGAIVATITGIAEQTNLLALNAAIEAARAGEQGRGFAVVAEEVRKLAEESQHAAQEISGLIGAIQDETTKAVSVVEDGARKTTDGASVVEQTREAFLQIGASVEDMAARVEQIAASAQQITASATRMQANISEVASVAEESSATTEQVSASTEETSASTEQIAASAQELASNAEDLNRLVAQFKTHDLTHTPVRQPMRRSVPSRSKSTHVTYDEDERPRTSRSPMLSATSNRDGRSTPSRQAADLLRAEPDRQALRSLAHRYPTAVTQASRPEQPQRSDRPSRECFGERPRALSRINVVASAKRRPPDGTAGPSGVDDSPTRGRGQQQLVRPTAVAGVTARSP